jgi:hypothetical protein
MIGFDELQLYNNLNQLLLLRLHPGWPKFPLRS